MKLDLTLLVIFSLILIDLISLIIAAYSFGRLRQMEKSPKPIVDASEIYLREMGLRKMKENFLKPKVAIDPPPSKSSDLEYFEYDSKAHADWEREQAEKQRYAISTLDDDEDLDHLNQGYN